jgi:putative phosphonate metabolism protein
MLQSAFATRRTSETAARYAVYFAPEAGSALDRFGSAWLGRDSATGAALAQPHLPAMAPARLGAITEAPRHYGFHATLKPPFSLSPQHGPADLLGAVAAFASRQAPITAPPLRLARMAGFLALVLSEPSDGVGALAAACVAAFEGFRAPATPEDVARRKAAGLTPRQRALLDRWGYPFVMDEYRFHMTLTGRLDDDEGQAVLAALMPLAAPFGHEPLVIDALSVFVQDHPTVPFRLAARYALTG